MEKPAWLVLFAGVLSLFVVVQIEAQEVEFTGYLVDIYCWDRPNHIGIDGANLETSPSDHYLHCLDVSFCRSGLVLLEEYDDGGSTKYRDIYYLDDYGNTLGYEYYDNELKSGDRQIGEQAIVKGNISGTVMVNGNLRTILDVQTMTFSGAPPTSLNALIWAAASLGFVFLAM